MQHLKILSIQSFSVNDTASLKAFISILGSRVLPVNSLQLTALGNIAGHKKFEIDLASILDGTFEIIKSRNQRVILHIGYLKDAAQIDLLIQKINQYKPLIYSIVVDPVCGDHGVPYVDKEIIKNWHQLIALADIALPNATEIKLLTNTVHKGIENAIHLFQQKYPYLIFVVTSIAKGNKIGYQLVKGGISYEHAHKKLEENYSGTGDLFAAFFLLNYYFKNTSLENALKDAAEKVLSTIEYSLSKKSNELLIELL